MNILQVHNRYRYTGGEWTALSQEYELLRKEHNVGQLIVDNGEELRSVLQMFRLPFRTHYNRSSKKKVQRLLTEGDYHVMHVHNFFPLLTPSVFDAARQAGVPSVMTLHNFRLLHPNGYLLHNGSIDERSIEGSAYKCVKDAVYRNSKLQTAVVAHMIEYHRRKKTWQRIPSLFIANTDFSKRIFVKGGLPEERIVIKPNFIEDPLRKNDGPFLHAEKEDAFLYVGRISSEKGVEDLIDCWMTYEIESTLMLAGDGPETGRLMKKTKDHPRIKWLGFLSKEEILSKMITSKALLFPTLWFECFPLTLVEALSVGCPVITSKIGNPQQIIEDGKTGLHFTPGSSSDLYRQVELINTNEELRKTLSRNARTVYQNNYTPEKNLIQLMDIYEQASVFERQLRGVT